MSMDLLLAEFVNRLKVTQALSSGLTPFQAQVRAYPSKRKAILSSRRLGKTHLCISTLLESAINYPATIQLYIALTRSNAKKLVWGPLKTLCKELDIEADFKEVDLICVLPNGSEIWLAGASDQAVIENLRGPKYKLVVIDESASYGGWLGYLIDDILEPALLDLDGSILLTGTPGKTLTGLFYEITSPRSDNTCGYAVFRGTLYDNPMVPAWRGKPNWQDEVKKYLDSVLQRKGITDQDPAFRREYLGEWVLDDSLNPYILQNASYTLPPANLSYVLGIDLGFVDESAYVVLGYDQYTQNVYEIQSFSRPRMDYSQIVETANQIVQAYPPEILVVDPSAGGKSLIAELQKRYDFPCMAAQKDKKGAFMRLWGSDIQTGKMHFLPNSILAEQLKRIAWNKQYTLEDPSCQCDLHDAALYAWRSCLHWIAQARPPIQTEEDRILQAEIDAFESDPLFG